MSNGMYTDLMTFYERKRKECPRGVTLKLQDNKLFLQFINPDTGRRSSKACGVSFTEKGILEAIDKAYKVSEALKRYSTSSEFWEWYSTEILGKNTIVNDLRTYREIFKEIEDNFFKGKHRNTGRQRERDITKLGGISDWTSFNRQYGDIFKLFPNWDTYPSWEEIKLIWDSLKQGTKSFKDAKTTMLAIAELCPNNSKLIRSIKSVNVAQTVFKTKQSIDLDTFLNWHKEQFIDLNSLPLIQGNAKKSWLWVASMTVVYGLRPSEVTAILNLTEAYTKDGVTVYPITDSVNNPECTVVVGEFTYFGASTKTGFRVVNPVPLKHLIDELKIRKPLLPIYNPKQGSKPESILTGFDNNFCKRMSSYNCPITQKYAFRHLYNQLLEMCGISTTIRSRLMGHSETTNSGAYKKRRNLKTELAIINSTNNRQPLPLEMTLKALQNNGIDTEDSTVKVVLNIVYQL